MGPSEGLQAAQRRRRGRPVGSDSAETRSRILTASRQVINERGYQAATFQAISLAAGLSRPTLHYYFSSREQIYHALVAEAGVIVADCVATARRETTLARQFSALLGAIHEAGLRDRSQIAFLVSARLESTRNRELHEHAGSSVLRDFLTSVVGEARARGELADDAAVAPVVEMMNAMLWGLGFYSGFVENPADLCPIANHLDRLVSHGLSGSGANSAARSDTYGDTPSTVGGPP